MVSRRRRLWLPFSTGGPPDTLAANSSVRVVIASINEAEVALERERYTLVRLILQMGFIFPTAIDNVAIAAIVLNENLLASTINPVGNPSSDWFYHEQFLVAVSTQNPAVNISRDIRAMRKMPGTESEAYVYITNRSTSQVLSFQLSGRMLVLT